MRAPITYDQVKARVFRLKAEDLNESKAERKADWEELFDRTLLDPCIAGFALLDNRFVLKKCNGIYAKIVRENAEYNVEHVIGKNYFDILPFCIDRRRFEINKILHSCVGKSSYNLRMEATHNERRHVSYWNENVSPLTDDEGRVTGCIVCLVHATRKATSDKINETSKLLESNDFCVADIRQHLAVLGDLVDNYSAEVRYKILNNIRKDLGYFVDCLRRTPLTEEQKTCVTGIEMFLQNAFFGQSLRDDGPYLSAAAWTAKRNGSPDNGIANDRTDLTTAEAKVAQWVCRGRSSKEIASIMGISKRCVDFHRNNIRRKLNLAERKINLGRYLRSIQA